MARPVYISVCVLIMWKELYFCETNTKYNLFNEMVFLSVIQMTPSVALIV